MDQVCVDGSVELRVFLDGSVLEVFTSTGRAATCRLYPLAPPPWGLRSEGPVSLTYWDLSNTYRDSSTDAGGGEAQRAMP